MKTAATHAGLDRNRGRPARVLAAICWLYVILLIGIVVFLRTQGDRTVVATVLIFSPRWIWLLPLVGLVPLSLWLNRRLWTALLVSVLIGLFPLLEFNLGLGRLRKSTPGTIPLRIVTFNIHHLDMADPLAVRFIRDANADIVALEEVPAHINPSLFPNGWHVVRIGENLIASRLPVVSSEEIIWGAAASYKLDVEGRGVEVIVVHLASPHFPLRDSLVGTPQGNRDLLANIAKRADAATILDARAKTARGPLIIAGDFNLTPDSRLFRSSFQGLSDSFAEVGFGFGWTYRSHWTDLRIDHVLTNPLFTETTCRVAPDLGSPHRPLVADLQLNARLVAQ